VLQNKSYIALGTNIGNWKNNFNQAIKSISKIGLINQISSIYLSSPYGYQEQNFFYNLVLELDTNLSPYKLFNKLQVIEKNCQKNKLFINGPRKIDLDIIFFNRMILNTRILTIPHQSAHLRDFVLLPFLELSPFYFHPKEKKTIACIYKQLNEKYVFSIKRRRKESLVIY